MLRKAVFLVDRQANGIGGFNEAAAVMLRKAFFLQAILATRIMATIASACASTLASMASALLFCFTMSNNLLRFNKISACERSGPLAENGSARSNPSNDMISLRSSSNQLFCNHEFRLTASTPPKHHSMHAPADF